MAQKTNGSAGASEGQSQREGEQSDDLSDVIRNRRALKAAMSDLEGSLARPLGPDAEDWLSEVVASSDVVREELGHHIETHEGPGSFHEEVLASQPYLAPRVAKLQREHSRAEEISSELFDALKSARNAKTVAHDASRIRMLGSELLMLLVRHRQSGADLVWESVNLDLGSGE